jgi:hypothetical protein
LTIFQLPAVVGVAEIGASLSVAPALERQLARNPRCAILGLVLPSRLAMPMARHSDGARRANPF